MSVHVVGEKEQKLQKTSASLFLWAPVLVGPIAFLLKLELAYILVPYACATGTLLSLHLVTLFILLVVAASGWLGWRMWQEAGPVAPGEGEGVIERSRFLAAMGILTSALFLIVMLAQWLPIFFYSPCQRL